VNVGNTFIDGKYNHLWLIISDPAADSERIVIVNFTKHTTEKEEDCVINPGQTRNADSVG
jgi:hypothetical protein